MSEGPLLGETSWLSEPPDWSEECSVLRVVTGKEKDFWNRTFYGFRHLDGHFRGTEVSGNFSLEVTFSASYKNLYDQAGAMIWVDENNWLKCGVEFTDGKRHFSVVCTRDDQSDWSVLPLDGAIEDNVTLRLTRHDEALRIQMLMPDGSWQLTRLCFLNMPHMVQAGPMTCSPTGEGLIVTFSRVAFLKPIDRELH